MAANDWPRVLRRQFGSEQAFDLQRLDGLDLKAARRLPVFADFWVGNAATGGRYQVAIRGALPGDSLCSCLDFATNDLGTCKHIEFTLARLRARRGGKAALKQGFAPPYSEVYLHQAGLRTVRFRLGADCPPGLLDRARQLFDEAAGWVLPPARLAELDRFIQTHEHETNRTPMPCVSTTARWPTWPSCVMPNTASRCWPRPTPRVPPTRDWPSC